MRRIFLLVTFTAMLAAGGCRVGPRSAQVSVPGQAASDSATSASAAAAESTPSAGADSAGAEHAPVLPVPELGYNAREGRVLYRHYCLFCHGDEGGGDGFNAYNLDPRPRALADSTFQAGHSDDDLAAAIRSGGGAVGLSTGMPPWGRTLNERKIRNIVEFLRSLRAKTAASQ